MNGTIMMEMDMVTMVMLFQATELNGTILMETGMEIIHSDQKVICFQMIPLGGKTQMLTELLMKTTPS